MRPYLLLTLALLIPTAARADEALDAALKHIPGELEDFTYKFKIDHFAHRPISEGGVVMFGDSLTDLGGWSEFFPNVKMINRGIGGDNTLGMLNRVDQVIALQPSAVFILAGTNDLYWGASPIDILERFSKLVDRLAIALPHSTIVIQTVPPFLRKPMGDYGYLNNDTTRELNSLLVSEASKRNLAVIDLYSSLVKDGEMDSGKTTDGVHLNGRGYEEWVKLIKPHLSNH